MKRNILTIALSSSLILSSLIFTGCSSNNTDELQNKNALINNTESLGNKKKIATPIYKELKYSNLLDLGIQEEVKVILMKNGINKEDVERYFKGVNNYNKIYKDDLPNITGFSVLEKSQVPYDEFAFQDKWIEKNKEYFDINCRISALRLVNQFIESKDDFYESNGQLGMDIDTIEKNPDAMFNKNDINKFKKLFDIIEIDKFGTDEEIAKFISDEWDKRGISFVGNSDVTLISGFSKNEDTKELLAGHVGVAVKNDDEILFIEKYSPATPYQVTKFKNKEELRSYMFDRLISTEGDAAMPGAIIMENNKLMR